MQLLICILCLVLLIAFMFGYEILNEKEEKLGMFREDKKEKAEKTKSKKT